ncbi:MAG: OmpA family protein [Bacteroidaceae bacterium]|nr:OmpA family protein [Bacteroidaceae bacterium]
MKKISLIVALATMALGANAQNATVNSKFADNMFVSLQGGVYEPTIGQNVFADMRPVVRLEIGKYFTPTIGVSVSGEALINMNNGNRKSNLFYNTKFSQAPKTAFDFSNVSANALINLNNLFLGYKGQPSPVELVANAGLGWGHLYGKSDYYQSDKNCATANFGLAVNINVSDAWAINIKPGISYLLSNNRNELPSSLNFFDMRTKAQGEYELGRAIAFENEYSPKATHWVMDVRNTFLQLTAGVTYKFGNSNGTHHFVFCDKKYSQSEMDELNGRINSLRGEINGKNKTIADLEAALAAERAKDKTVIVNETKVNQTQLAPVVIFDQGKSIINKAQQPSVQMIATYMKNHPESKVTIKGYASPEGSAELNQKLSENRAKAVYNMLVNTYKINANRLQWEGLGATSEVFPENDWNRVCVFLEEAK